MPFLLIVLIAWLYVALMMAAAEALHPAGHWWSAVLTFVLYGVGPVSLVVYLFSTPLRRKARARAEAASLADQADGGGQSAGDTVAAEREETR